MTPFQWAAYNAPQMNMVLGNAPNTTQGFWRPADSKLPQGQDLINYIAPAGLGVDPTQEINRSVKFDGAMTREMMGNSTGFLNKQMGTGFQGLQDSLDQYAQYGGIFGDKNSPIYSPQSQNGYGSMWGNNNPFKIGSF